MENKDNDIELLAGQVWNAPERPTGKFAPFNDEEMARMADYFARLHDETLVRFLKPQAEIVRHTIPPDMSENTHEAPHYSDLLPTKNGGGNG